MNSFVCSFIHSFFLSFIDSLIHCWRYALMGCLMDSLTRCIHWIVHSCVRTFVFVVAWFRSSAQFVHSSIQSCIDPVIHSFIHSIFLALHCPGHLISFHHSLVIHACFFLQSFTHRFIPDIHACMHAFSISYLYSSFISSCLFISFRCVSCPSSLPSFIQPSLIWHMHIHKTKNNTIYVAHMQTFIVCVYIYTDILTHEPACRPCRHACMQLHAYGCQTYV